MVVIVLDTNVLVSSLLSQKASPGKILDLIIGNQIRLAYDDRILGEYEEVLSRPELHILASRVLATVDYIELSGKYVIPEPTTAERYPDPDDVIFAEVFIASQASALVTGNLRHYQPLIRQNMRVLSPVQFLDQYFPTDK